MSGPRRIYSKTKIRLLAGAPGALARPPNLLALVDRSKYENHISPDRVHSSMKTHQKFQKQRHASHAVSSQISPAYQKWKPKHNDGRTGNGYTTRHWDQAPAPVDDDEEEPEWADEAVDYTENFDFSQATLERDKTDPEPQIAPAEASPAMHGLTPRVSRFGFALEDSVQPDVSQPTKPVVVVASETVQMSSSQAIEYTPVRHSRFKFTDSPEPATDDLQPTLLQHRVTTSTFTSRHESSEEAHSVNLQARPHRPELKFDHHAQYSPDQLQSLHAPRRLNPTHVLSRPADNSPLNRPPLSVPKGKPIEVSQMFQMYALANSLPPTPSTHPAVSPNSHGVPIQMTLPRPPNRMDAVGGMPVYQHSATLPVLHNPSLSSPASGLHHGLTDPNNIPIRPLSIAGLGQPQPSVRQLSQPALLRSKSGSSERRRNRDDANEAANRPKAPVPAAAAPPSYVHSYMNIQKPQQPTNSGYYVPPGMMSTPTQGYMGQHMPYPPSPSTAPYR